MKRIGEREGTERRKMGHMILDRGEERMSEGKQEETTEIRKMRKRVRGKEIKRGEEEVEHLINMQKGKKDVMFQNQDQVRGLCVCVAMIGDWFFLL